MPSLPLFAVAAEKIGRAKTEMARLAAYLEGQVLFWVLKGRRVSRPPLH